VIKWKRLFVNSGGEGKTTTTTTKYIGRLEVSCSNPNLMVV
jgi:hypothetical protein